MSQRAGSDTLKGVTTEKAERPKTSYWQELLVFRPPGPPEVLRDADVQQNGYVYLPELRIHCPSPGCHGIRTFDCTSGESLRVVGGPAITLATYRCRNCQVYEKVYAVAVDLVDTHVTAQKFGELPEFESPSSPRLDRLLGDGRELFRKGQRCESLGLGIGAFGYYRRVVEGQRDAILDMTIRAAKAVEAGDDILQRLAAAREEREFTRSIEMAADALPGALMIAGQNPLKILHGALSEGLHESPDERCLELAGNIRVVLVALAQRTAELVADDTQIRQALGRLNNRVQ